MISGFGGSTRVSPIIYDRYHLASNLPIPFNIPKVLYNLLYEDIGIEFDAKQQDVLEALRFSYVAFEKLQEKNKRKLQEIQSKMLQDLDNKELKKELEDMKLDMLSANQQFKDMVITISDMLKREQYEKLLAFSGIAT